MRWKLPTWCALKHQCRRCRPGHSAQPGTRPGASGSSPTHRDGAPQKGHVNAGVVLRAKGRVHHDRVHGPAPGKGCRGALPTLFLPFIIVVLLLLVCARNVAEDELERGVELHLGGVVGGRGQRVGVDVKADAGAGVQRRGANAEHAAADAQVGHQAALEVVKGGGDAVQHARGQVRPRRVLLQPRLGR